MNGYFSSKCKTYQNKYRGWPCSFFLDLQPCILALATLGSVICGHRCVSLVVPIFFLIYISGPSYHVHWHVEKSVEGDTKLYERDILGHKSTVWNLRNRIFTFMRNSSCHFSLGNCSRLVYGWTANCSVIEELFLRNSCKWFVLLGMVLFLFKL